MHNSHIIVGTGHGVDVPKSVIHEALRDAVKTGDTVVVPWMGGKPEDAMAHVYDYLLDLEVSFLMIHDGGSNIPGVFTSSDKGVVQNVADMATAFVEERSDEGTAFVLGLDEVTDTWLLDIKAKADATQFLDLSNGLIPIAFEDEGPVPEETPDAEEPVEETPDPVEVTDVTEPAVMEVNDEDPTDDGDIPGVVDPHPFDFAPEELANMPMRVIKRLAEKVLGEVPKSKDDILEAIDRIRPVPGGDVEGGPSSMRDHMRDILTLLREENDVHFVHPNAITRMEEALLWYSYGHEVQGGN